MGIKIEENKQILTTLPYDAFEHSFGFLGPADLESCKRVCHLFKAVVVLSPQNKKQREMQLLLEGQAALAGCNFFASSGGAF